MIDPWLVALDIDGTLMREDGVVSADVIAAVQRSLQLVQRHGAQLYAAPAGARVELADAPERPSTP